MTCEGTDVFLTSGCFDFLRQIEYERKKKEEGKRARADKQQVLDMLFSAFEKHQFYNIKDLVDITKQPVVRVPHLTFIQTFNSLKKQLNQSFTLGKAILHRRYHTSLALLPPSTLVGNVNMLNLILLFSFLWKWYLHLWFREWALHSSFLFFSQIYLKEILRDIGIYNVKGTHKNTWELKPEYRHYQGEEKTD